MSDDKRYKKIYTASKKQILYIEQLRGDLGYNRVQMYDSMTTILGYLVTDINDISMDEASRVIAEYKRRKTEKLY